MRENNNDSEEKENEEEDRRNKTEAGMARGAVRSLGRTAAQLPAVGRLPAAAKPLQLPRPAAVMPRRLPVKQVAKISDRVSQTLDLYDLAAAESAKESHLAKLLGFTLNLVKNTLLGLAVFEAYGAVIERMAPISSTNKGEKRDPYAQASVTTHAFAGSVGGFSHGVAGTVWDTIAAAPESRRSVLRTMPRMVVHHGLAHSVLFGGYEGAKRVFLSYLNSNSEQLEGIEPVTRIEFLGCVAVAGGLAGQAQHLLSHYSEQVFTSGTPETVRWSGTTLRPLLFAFIPSSIAFVALEYGRNEQ